MGTRAGAVLRNEATVIQLSALDMRFLGLLGVCGIIAQGSLQPEGPESRILLLPPPAAPFLPSACNSGLTLCELEHLPSGTTYPTSHVRRLTHKLKRLRGSILLLQPAVNNVTDSVVTDYLKRLKPRLQRPPGTVQSEPDGGLQRNRGQGARPNMLTSTGVPGVDQPSKPTHSSQELL